MVSTIFFVVKMDNSDFRIYLAELQSRNQFILNIVWNKYLPFQQFLGVPHKICYYDKNECEKDNSKCNTNTIPGQHNSVYIPEPIS